MIATVDVGMSREKTGCPKGSWHDWLVRDRWAAEGHRGELMIVPRWEEDTAARHKSSSAKQMRLVWSSVFVLGWSVLRKNILLTDGSKKILSHCFSAFPVPGSNKCM